MILNTQKKSSHLQKLLKGGFRFLWFVLHLSVWSNYDVIDCGASGEHFWNTSKNPFKRPAASAIYQAPLSNDVIDVWRHWNDVDFG